MADTIDDLLRKRQVMPDLRPTQDRPLYHPSDPKTLDYGLQKAAEGLFTPAMMAGGAAEAAGPRMLWNMLPAVFQATFGSQTKKDPRVLQDEIYPLFHGTPRAFGEYDPNLSHDLGTHFGTLGQAENRVKTFLSPEQLKDLAPGRLTVGTSQYGTTAFEEGANIRPVNVDIDNPARTLDRFGLGWEPKRLVRELLEDYEYIKGLGYKEPALKFSPENEEAMKNWASSYRPEKELWKIVQKQAKESGHDALVYRNQFEGPGDSFIIFDPKKATPRFGSMGRGQYDPTGGQISPPIYEGR